MLFQASLSGHSSFVAAYLYYDLCERLMSFGKLSEVKLLYVFYIFFQKNIAIKFFPGSLLQSLDVKRFYFAGSFLCKRSL